ncbi:MAG: GntR family transcriptional regulator [Halanaerobiaceae bacterium]
MAIDELTKKEQIINFAQSDPFLKISDIAEHVQTTPRYVRTILSEANISLMKLRERYAKNMEERLEKDKGNNLQAKVSLRPEYSYNNHDTGQIQIEDCREKEFPDIQKIKDNDELMRIYQIKSVDDRVYCLHELITYMDSRVNRERLKNLETIYDLLGRKGIHRLQFMNNVLTVDQPERDVREYFAGDAEIITCKRTVLLNKIPIGRERMYINSDLTEVEFPGEIVV